ncbi:fungal-specific transcription factor domain-containing protein [Fusarium flagelliforme]|uniref:fungal-specific transcription factor domain-containing protein n=1 Tax=Fusarium flagelliforme TaxID=2675880 RepID=UPI001E8D8910|nr:fungal-specific transcription factor domain-containing protein [Fusarium flagelliforme]KAH7188206.1 fungal-specific transcription factor domain-containing protein [Fusarium flagelliforme]
MKGQHKSRSGCQACKSKRLKCDEAKPKCHNCISRKITCPGYQQTLKWSTKYERRKSNTHDPPGFDQLIFAASVSVQDSRRSSHTSVSIELSPGVLSTDDHGIASPVDNSKQPLKATVPDQELIPVNDMPLILQTRAPTKRKSEETEEPHCRRRSPFHITTAPNNAISEPSSFLIELWFKSVCGSWAAYDSSINPFRRLGSSLWSSSRPLFYSLQSMAAASITKRQPEIQEIAISAPRIATEAIIHELRSLFDSPNSVTTVPHALIISLFCLSSSLCWMDHKQLGLQYLRHVRMILSLLEMRSEYLSKQDRSLVGFFKECLIYEESVRSIVTSTREDISTLTEWAPAMYPPYDFVLHPWTGVPPKIIALFGKSMSLCRRSRDTWRNCTAPTYEVMWQTMLDINEAQTLEETLLSVRVPKLISDASENYTNKGQINLDLHHAAEVFRLCSLLQLYQTFPDLVSRRLPDELDKGSWSTSLALYITGLLANIPSESIRCLQPLLCLGVGSGLRCKTVPEDGPSRLELLDHAEESDEQQFTDVDTARVFIMDRLRGFGNGPATGPIVVLRDLLQAVWSYYDSEITPGSIHWLDVMADLKYETVFG